MNIQKYPTKQGGYHRRHSENCGTLYRALFFRLYLNDFDEGRETEFSYQKKRVSARKGRSAFLPADFTHKHKGHIPVSNDKLIATSSVLYHRFEKH